MANPQSITPQYFSRDYAPHEDRTRNAGLSTHITSALTNSPMPLGARKAYCGSYRWLSRGSWASLDPLSESAQDVVWVSRLDSLELGFGLGAGCGVGMGFGYGLGKGVAYDENGRLSNIGRFFNGRGNVPIQDDISGLVDELVVNTKKLIQATSREMDKWRR